MLLLLHSTRIEDDLLLTNDSYGLFQFSIYGFGTWMVLFPFSFMSIWDYFRICVCHFSMTYNFCQMLLSVHDVETATLVSSDTGTVMISKIIGCCNLPL